MKVSKHFNWIKLTELSEQIWDQGFEQVDITGNINCCTENCEETVVTHTLEVFNNLRFYMDFNEPVRAMVNTQAIRLRNIVSWEVINLDTPIGTSEILSNCSDTSCTLENSNIGGNSITTIVQDILMNYFTSQSIPASITAEVSGNIVSVLGMPTNFVIESILYGEGPSESWIEVPAGFGEVDGKFILNNVGSPLMTIYIKPDFFVEDATEHTEGVHKYKIKFTDEDGGYTEEQNCAFIDITMKCKVASVMSGIIVEANKQSKTPDDMAIAATMMHYALVNGSNCACNCEELCKLYKGLADLIDTINPNVSTDCG